LCFIIIFSPFHFVFGAHFSPGIGRKGNRNARLADVPFDAIFSTGVVEKKGVEKERSESRAA